MLKHLLLLLPLTLALAACPPTDDDDSGDDDDDATEPLDFRVWSPDFVSADTLDDNPHDCEEALPPEFSCFNQNPEIRWEGAPEGTVAFALIFDDPSAGNFPHWAIYNIPGDADGLDQGISGGGGSGIPDDSTELENGANQSTYLGSCPGATSVNRYRWRLWALSEALDTPDDASFTALAADAEAASIDMVDMCSVFDGATSDI